MAYGSFFGKSNNNSNTLGAQVHITGTTYTVSASDDGKTLITDSDSNIAITLPRNIKDEVQIVVIQGGLGVPSFVAETGASIECGLDGPDGVHRSPAYRLAAMIAYMSKNEDGLSSEWWIFGTTQVSI